MPHEVVIRGGEVQRDTWTFPDTLELGAPLPEGAVAVPLAAWREHREALLARGQPVGVTLEPGDDPAAIAPDLHFFTLVAVRFPKFTDGRGYSTAVLLRTRYGYGGELRAIGDVGRDQLAYLRRCGFDAFALPPHRDPREALRGLPGLGVRYQGAVDEPLPLFRRRLQAGVRHG